MASNWQPPFGMPFASSLQQPQQQAQSAQPNGQGGPTDQYNAPTPEASANSWNLPGLNLQAYSQNAQQPQYPVSAWPPPIPTPEAWNQMQQMHMHFPFMMQNGAVPPPPIPAMSFPPAPLPHTPLAPFQNMAPSGFFPTPSAQPIQPAHQPTPLLAPHAAANDSHSEVMDSDKEDGEVSEGDQTAPSLASQDRRYPEPPRSVPQDNPAAVQKEPHAPEQPATSPMSNPPVQQEQKRVETSDSPGSTAQQREDAKQFVRLLHQNNMGYRTLADEGLDAAPLRELYRSLNLPSEPEPVPPPKPSSTAPPRATGTGPASRGAAPPITNGTKPTTLLKTNVAAVPPAKSVPSPVDRKDYIARLQAAKLAKQGAKVTTPQKTPAASAPPVAENLQPSAAASAGHVETDEEKKARTTELIRQRLEALKKNPSSPAAPLASRLPATQPPFNAAASSTPVPILQTSPSTTNAQIPPIVPSPQFSGIPGLFMNSQSDANYGPVSSTPVQSTGGARTRKRPLKSGIIAVAATSNASLGQTRTSHNGLASEPTLVDVSDGEYEGSEMDMSDDHAAKPVTATPSASNRNEQPDVRASPVIANLPSRPASVIPAVSTVGTPGPQTPGSQARSEQRNNNELELARLKVVVQKKMKEAREKKLLVAAASPKPSNSLNELSNVQPVAIVSQSDQTAQEPQVPSPTPERAEDAARESKRRRRAEIESGLPSLDAEIASNVVRMAQLTKEMEELAANNEKMKQDKERLVRELENLGVDTEGMPHAELQAKKDEIERERETMSENQMQDTSGELPAASPDRAEDAIANVIAPSQNLAASQENFRALEESEQLPSPPVHTMSSVQQWCIRGLNASINQQTANSPLPSTVHQVSAFATAPEPLDNASTDTRKTLQEEMPHHPALLDDIHRDSQEAAGVQQSTAPSDDEEDFYSPAPADNIPTTAEPEGPVASHLDAISVSEQGEVAMSESEEEYEPEELEIPPEPRASNVDGQGAAVVQSSSASSLTPSPAGDEEVYEPPDIDQPMLDIEPSQTAMNNNLGTQQGEAEDGAMDISSSSAESDSSDFPSPSPADNTSPEQIAFNMNVQHSVTVADDLAPQLQAEPPAIAVSGVEASVVISKDDPEPAAFVPYESPLKHFKSYRYHPNYAQEIPSGFLSMTFSHQIDPDQPVCPTEADGVACTNPDCPYQHFQGMNITGEKLLVQLGTANPGKTPDERQRWNDGLRGVLKDLRQRNIKDPDGIAVEIARYRRQFLNDDSRVVNL